MKVKKMKDKRTSTIIMHNVLIGVLAVIWLVPIVWLVCTSFSEYTGINTSTFFPQKWSIANYVKLFHPDTVAQFPQWFLNTFIVACVNCVISTFVVLIGCICNINYAFPYEETTYEYCGYTEPVPRYVVNDCCIFRIKNIQPDKQLCRTDNGYILLHQDLDT